MTWYTPAQRSARARSGGAFCLATYAIFSAFFLPYAAKGTCAFALVRTVKALQSAGLPCFLNPWDQTRVNRTGRAHLIPRINILGAPRQAGAGLNSFGYLVDGRTPVTPCCGLNERHLNRDEPFRCQNRSPNQTQRLSSFNSAEGNSQRDSTANRIARDSEQAGLDTVREHRRQAAPADQTTGVDSKPG